MFIIENHPFLETNKPGYNFWYKTLDCACISSSTVERDREGLERMECRKGSNKNGRYGMWEVWTLCPTPIHSWCIVQEITDGTHIFLI